MTSSVRQPPSPTMRRRLAASVERGWLLRLHGIDCTHLVGTVASLDRARWRCLLEAPGTLQPERDVELDGVSDVEVLSVALVDDGRLVARCAVIPAWRGGSADPTTVIADLYAGDIAVGRSVIVLLPSGERRRGTVTARQGQRCRLACPEPYCTSHFPPAQATASTSLVLSESSYISV